MLDVGKYGRFGGRVLKYFVPKFWNSPLEVKPLFRELCKETEEYHLPIQPVRVSSTGIEVNTLGRWAFGVPGYMGHCKFYEEDGVLTIEIPGYIPELVRMFDKAAILAKQRYKEGEKKGVRA